MDEKNEEKEKEIINYRLLNRDDEGINSKTTIVLDWSFLSEFINIIPGYLLDNKFMLDSSGKITERTVIYLKKVKSFSNDTEVINYNDKIKIGYI